MQIALGIHLSTEHVNALSDKRLQAILGVIKMYPASTDGV